MMDVLSDSTVWYVWTLSSATSIGIFLIFLVLDRGVRGFYADYKKWRVARLDEKELIQDTRLSALETQVRVQDTLKQDKR